MNVQVVGSFLLGERNILLLSIRILSGKTISIGDKFVNKDSGLSFLVTATPTGTYDYKNGTFYVGITTNTAVESFYGVEFEKEP